MIQRPSYESFIAKTFDLLSENLLTTPFSSEIDFTNNVLSWKVENIGEYVFNKQPPLKQLWISSPITGPAKFEIKSNSWTHTKSRASLGDFLNREIEEISKKLGKNITKEPPRY